MLAVIITFACVWFNLIFKTVLCLRDDIDLFEEGLTVINWAQDRAVDLKKKCLPMFSILIKIASKY